MPTLNPRLSVTLKPSTSALLERMSELTEQSRSSIVSEILESSEPVFQRMVEVLQAARLVKDDLKQGTKARLEEAEGRLHAQIGVSMDIFDDFSRPLLDAAETIKRRSPATRTDGVAQANRPPESPERPPHVTRGSGTPNKSQSSDKTAMKPGSGKALLKNGFANRSKQPAKALKTKVGG